MKSNKTYYKMNFQRNFYSWSLLILLLSPFIISAKDKKTKSEQIETKSDREIWASMAYKIA